MNVGTKPVWLQLDAVKIVSSLAAILVALVAALAFVLSYSSLQHLALTHSVGDKLSYVWPLLLDFSMIVFSLAILRANLRNESAVYPWILTGVFATLATVANILDVHTLGIPSVAIGASVKAIAPVALVLAFELFVSMVRAEVKRSNIAKSLEQLEREFENRRQKLNSEIEQKRQVCDTQIERLQASLTTKLEQMRLTLRRRFEQERSTLQAEIDALIEQVDSLTSRSVQLENDIDRLRQTKDRLELTSDSASITSIEHARTSKAEQADSDKETRLEQLLNILSNNPKPAITKLADSLGVSRGTVYNDLSALEERGLVHKNGNGIEVVAR